MFIRQVRRNGDWLKKPKSQENASTVFLLSQQNNPMRLLPFRYQKRCALSACLSTYTSPGDALVGMWM